MKGIGKHPPKKDFDDAPGDMRLERFISRERV
jgi:hypothetical protein